MPSKRLKAPGPLTAMLLAGCVGMSPDDRGFRGPDACGAQDFAAQVGMPVAAVTFPVGVRTIGLDTIVTEDFVPARLNVIVDARGVISGFRCG